MRRPRNARARCCRPWRIWSSRGAGFFQATQGNFMETETDQTARAAELVQRLRAAVGMAVVGQTAVIDQVLMALAASGHVLLEGVPGLGKTLLARALAQAMTLTHARVQFTPDLMPSDIVGF